MGKKDGRYYAPSEYEKYKNSIRARQDYSNEEEYSIHTDEHFYRQIEAENSRHIQRREGSVPAIPKPPVNTLSGNKGTNDEYSSVYDRIARKKKNNPKESWYNSDMLNDMQWGNEEKKVNKKSIPASVDIVEDIVAEPSADVVDLMSYTTGKYDNNLIDSLKDEFPDVLSFGMESDGNSYDDYGFSRNLENDNIYSNYEELKYAQKSEQVNRKAFSNVPLTEDETQSLIDQIKQSANFDEDSADQEYYTKEDIIGMCEFYRKKYSRKMWITLISSLSFFCVIVAMMYLYLSGLFDRFFM